MHKMHKTFTELQLITVIITNNSSFILCYLNVTFSVKQDLLAIIIAINSFIYVPTYCTLHPEDQCFDADKRCYSPNKLHLSKQN